MKTPVLSFLLLLTGMAAFCQPAQKAPHTPKKSCGDLFIEFSEALPRLYANKAFDSIRYYVALRERRCSGDMDLACIKILLDIENNTFTGNRLADRYFDELLDSYAGVLDELMDHKRRISYYSRKYFDATHYDRQLFGVTSAWARQLLDTRQPDSLSTFLCHVFAGDIRHPNAIIKKDKASYPELNHLLANSDVIRRNSPAVNASIGAGIWIPNGHLALLGSHPSVDFPVVGVRSKHNQLDMVFSFRFIRTANDYTLLRGGNLYSRHYFLGGYMGIDYTRYFLHTFHFESGIIAGAGYDGFDIAATRKGSNENAYLAPVDIGSFNANLGLRCNYFFNAGTYIGIAAKYNGINYANRGGSALDGNAVSIDLYVGHNAPKP